MADSGTYTPETIARRLAMAQQLLGDRKKPITHWAEGLDELAKGYFGGKMYGDAERAEKEAEAGQIKAISALLGGGSTVPAPYTPGPQSAAEPQIVPADQFNSIDAMADLKPETAAMLPRAQGAVAGIESGGRYDAMGPAIASGPMQGQRGVGKYQVMEGNVGPWTKEIMGKLMTPQQFAANPDAQDAVFNGKFGGYMEKHGPAGAARAWHAGEGGMNNPAAQDQLGTKTAQYGQNVAAALAGESIPPGARPTQAQGSADQKAQIIQMLNSPNPGIRKMGKSLATGLISKQMAPADYDIQQRPDGSVIAVNKKNPNDLQVLNAPGAGDAAIKFEADKAAAIEKAKKDVTQPERDKQKRQVADIVIEDVDRAIALIEKSPLTTTGTVGPWLATIGGTPANDVRALVDTVKANAGFAELQKMRDNSPTGGALGQVSEREIAYLQSTIGNLEQSQTAEQFVYNLRRVKAAYQEIIHGTKGGAAPAGAPADAPKVRKFNPETGKIE